MSNSPIPDQIRDISQLKEPFLTKIMLFLEKMKEIDAMAVHETFRTQERQDWLVKHGKSWVKVSNHQLGLAADVHFVTYPHFPKSNSERWRKAWDIAQQFGIDNGQDLWGTDGNHLQDDGTPVKTEFVAEKDKKNVSSFDFQPILHDFGEIWHEITNIEQTLANIRKKLNVNANFLRHMQNKQIYNPKTQSFEKSTKTFGIFTEKEVQ